MSLQQVLAPQLQQSLALLQAPTLELKALVEQELQQNPVLEEVPVEETEQKEKNQSESENESAETPASVAADPKEPPADLNFDPASEKINGDPVDQFQAEFERLTQMDQEWRDHFAQTNLPMRDSAEDEEKRQYMFDSLVAGTSLQENLMEQVRLSDLSEEQQAMAEMIIGNIDDYGYLKTSVEEMAFSTSLTPEKILEVLRTIQTFQPAGVGARDLRECLMLQLEREGRENSVEYLIIRDQMDALGRRRLPEIARALDRGVEEIQEAVRRIARLEPRPGRAFLPDNDQFIVAEVFVTKVGDEFVISTNNDHIPHLRISNTYKDLMAQADSSAEVREYIREKIRAGKFLIKSIQQRQQTIINIAKENRPPAARVHGKGRRVSQTLDDGAGGGGGRGA